MPTYDYQCTACGHAFELFQKMSDEPVAECPECGEQAERQISGGAGFLFKGEGFYITDYRSEDYKKKAAKEVGEPKPAKTSGSTGSSEAKDAGSAASETRKGGETSSPSSSRTTSSSDD